eukprot:TRINITY_DN9459_c0_g1_i1.p1 TRINITY_DN9459_c0_g1~~TRINITY_DN9459_c0_g1_i1.p1  ORF type:complete len:1808 (+),score=622.46 TRINITY_DN9459_c0_g1_i1:55-5478(+)
MSNNNNRASGSAPKTINSANSTPRSRSRTLTVSGSLPSVGLASPTTSKANTPAPKSPSASKRATVNLSAMGFDPKSLSIPSSPSSTAENSPVSSARSDRRRSMSISKGVVSTILSEPRDNFSCYITSDLLKKITKKDNLKDITSLAIHQPDQRVKYIESLEECTNLRELDLSQNIIEKIKGLDTLTSLEVLNLSENAITKWEGLATLKALQTLDLSSNGLTRLSSSIANHAALTVLKLHGNQLNVLRDVVFLKSCKNLIDLTLHDNPLASLGSYREFVIFQLPQLETLDETHITSDERAAASDRFGREEINLLETKIAQQQQELNEFKKKYDEVNDALVKLKDTEGQWSSREKDWQNNKIRLEQELKTKTDMLNNKSNELIKMCELLYEVKQELAFYKIDASFDDNSPQPVRVNTFDTASSMMSFQTSQAVPQRATITTNKPDSLESSLDEYIDSGVDTSELKKKISELDKLVQSQQQLIQDLQKFQHDTFAEQGASSDTIAALKREIELLKKEREQLEANVKRNINAAAEVVNLQGEVQRQQSVISNLKTEIGVSGGQSEEERKRVQQLETEVQAIKAFTSELLAREEKMKFLLMEKEEHVTELKEALEEMEEKKKQMKQQIKEYETKIVDLGSNQASASQAQDQNVASLKSDKDRIEAQAFVLQGQLNAMKEELERYKKDLETASQKREEINLKAQQYFEELVTLRHQVQTLTAQNTSLTEKNTDLQKKVSDLEKQKSELDAKLANALQTSSSHTGEIEFLKREKALEIQGINQKLTLIENELALVKAEKQRVYSDLELLRREKDQIEINARKSFDEAERLKREKEGNESIASIVNEIVALKDENSKLKRDLEGAQSTQEKAQLGQEQSTVESQRLKGELEELRLENKNITAMKNLSDQRASQLQIDLESLRRELNEVKANRDNQALIQQLEQQIQQHLREIDELKKSKENLAMTLQAKLASETEHLRRETELLLKEKDLLLKAQAGKVDSLEAELKALRAEKQSTGQELDNLRKERNEYELSSKRLQEENAILQREKESVESISKQTMTLINDIAALKDDNYKLKRDAEVALEDKEKAITDLKRDSAKVEEAHARLSESETSKKQLESQILSLKQEMLDLKNNSADAELQTRKKHGEEISKLTDENKKLQREVEQLNSLKAQLADKTPEEQSRAEIEYLKKEIELIKREKDLEVQKEKQSLSQVEKDLEGSRAERLKLESQFERLKQEKEQSDLSAKEQISKLDTRVKTLELDLNHSQSVKKQKEQEVDEKHAKISQLEAELLKLKAESEGRKVELAKMNQQVENAASQKGEIEVLKSQTVQNLRVQEELTDLRIKNKQQEADLEFAKKKLEIQHEQYSEVNLQLEKIKKEKHELEDTMQRGPLAEIEMLKSDKANLEQQLQGMRDQHYREIDDLIKGHRDTLRLLETEYVLKIKAIINQYFPLEKVNKTPEQVAEAEREKQKKLEEKEKERQRRIAEEDSDSEDDSSDSDDEDTPRHDPRSLEEAVHTLQQRIIKAFNIQQQLILNPKTDDTLMNNYNNLKRDYDELKEKLQSLNGKYSKRQSEFQTITNQVVEAQFKLNQIMTQYMAAREQYEKVQLVIASAKTAAEVTAKLTPVPEPTVVSQPQPSMPDVTVKPPMPTETAPVASQQRPSRKELRRSVVLKLGAGDSIEMLQDEMERLEQQLDSQAQEMQQELRSSSPAPLKRASSASIKLGDDEPEAPIEAPKTPVKSTTVTPVNAKSPTQVATTSKSPVSAPQTTITDTRNNNQTSPQVINTPSTVSPLPIKPVLVSSISLTAEPSASS